VLFENLQHLIRHVFRALGSAKDANLRHQHILRSAQVSLGYQDQDPHPHLSNTCTLHWLPLPTAKGIPVGGPGTKLVLVSTL